MTDSQNEFAYSQVRDLVNKSIKSSAEEVAQGTGTAASRAAVGPGRSGG
jgi:hypothetical protein